MNAQAYIQELQQHILTLSDRAGQLAAKNADLDAENKMLRQKLAERKDEMQILKDTPTSA